MKTQHVDRLRDVMQAARFVLLPIASSVVVGCGAVDATVGLAGVEPAEVAITVEATETPGQSQATSLALLVGEEALLSATVLNALGQPVGAAAVTWGSTDGSVVTVVNGQVTAMGPGTAEVFAAVNEVFSTLPVQVVAPPEPPTAR